MLKVEYEFYRDTYQGDKISAEEWPALSRDASACLDEMTLGRTEAPLSEELGQRCRMALCAVAEELRDQREHAGGIIAAESVGSWSRTYTQTGSPAQKQWAAARRWLVNTGLMYRGGETLCGRIP